MEIAVVGLGVIGGSFVKALHSIKDPEDSIYGIDIDQTTLDFAREGGYIVYGERKNETILQEADLVIMGLYPEAMKSFLKEHMDEFKKDAIILDTSGVKQILLKDIDTYFPPQADLILGHPMAGRESRGFAYADGNIYDNANFLLTPLESNKKENIKYIVDLLYEIGFGRVTITTPEIHDEMIAFTSQLTHAIAVALMNSDQYENETIRFVGDSYRDLTRIANINEKLWAELFMENRDYLLKVIQQFKEEFTKLEEAVEEEDIPTLIELFQDSSKRRQALENSDYKLSKEREKIQIEKSQNDDSI